MRKSDLLLSVFCLLIMGGALSYNKYRWPNDPVVIILASSEYDSVHGLGGVGPIGSQLVAEGFKVFSIDLPCHGADFTTSGLICWRQRIGAGEQRLLSDFCPEVSRLIDTIGARRVQFVGVSLGGFVAYQCGAQDERVTEIAQISPATDLGRLSEFDGIELDAAYFDLDQYSPVLSNKGNLIRIGARDERVGTDAAVRFGSLIGAEIELLDVDGGSAPDPEHVMATWLRKEWQATF